ncbi:MAG: diguanylate cyclase [Methylophagaceae bacterium]|jgi:diguanylate cyclase
MSNQSSYPPVYNDPIQKASENMRQVIPLISKHKIPVNPANYAVWYEYVSGDNHTLVEEINNRLIQNLPISTEFAQHLFEKHVLMGMPERLESTNNGLKLVVDNTLGTLNKTEADAAHSISELNNTKSLLNNCRDINELHNLVSDILASTQMLTKASSELKQDLEKSSQEIAKLKEELSEIKETSRTDGLTGLLNRGAFNDELNAICEQPNTDIALALFDLDHFKKINDTYGHVLGDKILQYFSGLLKKHAGEDHLVARYGGEEMAMILMNISLEEATSITEKISIALADSRLKKKGQEEYINQVTVSAGISMLKTEDSPSSIIDRADQALYQSKNNGRNQVTII